MDNINAMIRIAKKYYELCLSQQQIAEEEEISKSSVSRVLKRAELLGYVRHEIIYPVKSIKIQEQLLKKIFDIDRIFIVPKVIDDIDLRLTDTCKIVAQDLNKMVSDNDIISVSWGRTLERLTSLLVPPVPPKKGIKVVQMNGSIATNILSTKTASILEKFTEAYSGIGYMLAAPALVDDETIAETIKRDSRIKMVLDLGKEANIAVFSIGQMSDQSVLVERGAITLDDMKVLSAAGAVGDIGTHYFDIDGNIVNKAYEVRTIGIELDDLKKKKHRIGVAVGADKADAIIGALNGGYMTSLYTDEITASCMLKRCEELGY
ncbi:MAG: sugar-binding domain-containing protein [Eubacteriales bacterium]|nr:sugar-binding domain-containing protein [Eubacteriales bacterium]